MQQLRPTPFDVVFENAAETTFPAIRTALGESPRDPRDRDGFLMNREVVSLLRELRPDEGLGEGIDQLAALIHHGYLFWAGGGHTVRLSSDHLPDILGHSSVSTPQLDGPALYTQLPERRGWAPVIPCPPLQPIGGSVPYPDPQRDGMRALG